MTLVYWPDNESDHADFDGIRYELKPGVNTIKSLSPKLPDKAVADHIVSKLGQWGARIVTGPDDQNAMDEATLAYLASTRRWAEGLLLEREKRNAPRRAAQLPDDKFSEDERTAQEWLASKASDLANL